MKIAEAEGPGHARREEGRHAKRQKRRVRTQNTREMALRDYTLRSQDETPVHTAPYTGTGSLSLSVAVFALWLGLSRILRHVFVRCIVMGLQVFDVFGGVFGKLSTAAAFWETSALDVGAAHPPLTPPQTRRPAAWSPVCRTMAAAATAAGRSARERERVQGVRPQWPAARRSPARRSVSFLSDRLC
jgi:hypothetical protein